IRLEGKAPDRHRPPRQAIVSIEAPDVLEHPVLLPLIDGLHRREQFRAVAMQARGTGQGLYVLWKTGTAISRARIDEMPADARVRTDSLPHGFNIGTHALGDVGD